MRLRVALYDTKFELRSEYDESTNHTIWSGMSMALLEDLRKVTGFEYEFVEETEIIAKLGVLPEFGSPWSRCLFALHSNIADLCPLNTLMTEERMKYATFLFPYLMEVPYSGFVLKAEKERSFEAKSFSVFDPFERSVWLVLVGCLIAIPVLFGLGKKFTKNSNLYQQVWFGFERLWLNLFTQGSESPVRQPESVVFAIWSVVALLVSHSYKSFFISSSSIRGEYVAPFANLQNMAAAGYNFAHYGSVRTKVLDALGDEMEDPDDKQALLKSYDKSTPLINYTDLNDSRILREKSPNSYFTRQSLQDEWSSCDMLPLSLTIITNGKARKYPEDFYNKVQTYAARKTLPGFVHQRLEYAMHRFAATGIAKATVRQFFPNLSKSANIRENCRKLDKASIKARSYGDLKGKLGENASLFTVWGVGLALSAFLAMLERIG